MRARKSFDPSSPRATLQRLAKQSLGSQEGYYEAVKCPEGKSKNDWLAVHIVDFYNSINILLGAISGELHTLQTVMRAGEFDYLYKDETTRKPERLRAIDYINRTFDLIETRLSDTELFPPGENPHYPRRYKKEVKDIFKRMYRIVAFLIVEQSGTFEQKGMTAHLNTAMKHFLCFVIEFRLLRQVELTPLKVYVTQNLSRHAGFVASL